MRIATIPFALAWTGILLIGGCAGPKAQRAPDGVPLVEASFPAETAAVPEPGGPVPWTGDSIATIADGGMLSSGVNRGYLQDGPVFRGSEQAAEAPRTATERALALKEENGRLGAEIEKIKHQVARIEDELDSTKASLARSMDQRKAIQDELAAARSDMAQWKGELESIAQLIRENERNHVSDLDALIGLVERLVEDSAPPPLPVADRPVHQVNRLKQEEPQR